MTVSNEQFVCAEVLPDGDGNYTPCPALLTEEEAIRYLRIDKQKANAAKTLERYRTEKMLKATKIGNNLLYSRNELDRFVEKMTY